MTSSTNRTVAEPRRMQCQQCGTHYVYYGLTEMFWYVDGQGPFCRDCATKGVAIAEPQFRTISGTTDVVLFRLI